MRFIQAKRIDKKSVKFGGFHLTAYGIGLLTKEPSNQQSPTPDHQLSQLTSILLRSIPVWLLCCFFAMIEASFRACESWAVAAPLADFRQF